MSHTAVFTTMEKLEVLSASRSRSGTVQRESWGEAMPQLSMAVRSSGVPAAPLMRVTQAGPLSVSKLLRTNPIHSSMPRVPGTDAGGLALRCLAGSACLKSLAAALQASLL